MDAVPLVGMLVLWLNAFSTANTIGGYSQTSIMTYYILGYLYSQVTGCHFDEGMNEEIRKGGVVFWLVKPISLKRFLFVREMAWRTMTLFLTVLPVWGLTAIIAPQLLPVPSLFHLVLLPVFLVIAYTLEVMYSYMVVAMAFVFEQARSLEHLKWMLSWLLSGSMIPPEFMPSWLRGVIQWLPFQFRFYVPVRLTTGEIGGVAILWQGMLAMVWLVILWVFVRWLWQRNLRSFTAVGS